MAAFDFGAGDHRVVENVHIQIVEQFAHSQGENRRGITADQTLIGVALTRFAVLPVCRDRVKTVFDRQTQKLIGHTLDDLGAPSVAHGDEEVDQSDGGEAS